MSEHKQFIKPAIRTILVSNLIAFAGLLTLVLRLGYPYHRWASVCIFAVAGVVFAYGLRHWRTWLRGHRERLLEKLAGRGGVLAFAGLLVAFAYLFWVLVPVDKSPLAELDEAVLAEEIRNDLTTLLVLNENMKTAYARFSKEPLFAKGIHELSREERNIILEHWYQFVSGSFELDLLKEKYQGFLQVEDRELSIHAFCIAYGAYVAQYRGNLFLSKLVAGNAYVEAILNERNESAGIPEQTYYALQQHTTHPRTLLRFNAGKAYLAMMEKYVVGFDEQLVELNEAINQVDSLLLQKPGRFVDHPLDFFERIAFDTWLPLQERVALGLSHIRVASRPNLVGEDLLKEHLVKMEPGDILLQRRNWYATNLGIPGYWPHAALYMGSLDELDAYFEKLPSLEGESVSALFERRWPELYAQMEKGDEEGRAFRIVEAIAPGVVLNTWEQSCHSDSLAVLRPRCDLESKLQALLIALSHHGKPYDYNFDFATDNEFVCSELVYKAYESCADVNLPLTQMNGRDLLPPNLIAEKFDQEWDSAKQELDLVLFLDGNEAEGTAVLRDVSAFRQSWQRPKWYLLTAD